MARFVESFVATNSGDLVTAVNTFLATLTNPTIRGVDFSIVRQDGRIGDEYSLVLRYDDGGAVLATPFLVRVDESVTLDTAATALQTFLTANAAYFVNGGALQMVDGGEKYRKYSILTMYNTTGGASANYLTL